MHTKTNFTWRLMVSCMLVVMLLSPVAPSRASVIDAPSAPQDLSTITLDGLRDAGYVKIASDPSGDLGGPGGWVGTQWTDLTNLYVAADATTLYVYADLPLYDYSVSTGQIGLVMDVDAKLMSGGASDPWANAITFDYQNVDGAATSGTMLPDYVIRGNIYGNSDGGWTELRSWTDGSWATVGTNWGGISGAYIGTHVAYSNTHGVEFSIPLIDIGSPDPANVHLQMFATQSGGSKGAYDTVPSDNQSAGWDNATTQTQLVSAPLAVDPAGDLAADQSSFFGVAWTDMTRLHIWADYNTLYLFIPSEAYSVTASEGQIALAINTKDGGGSGDAWGNNFTFSYDTLWQNLGHTPQTPGGTFLPDYLMRGNIFGNGANGWTELRTWNGSSWENTFGGDWGGIGNSGSPSQPGSKVAWSDGDGLRLRIPFADIGVAGGDTISLEFFGTQGGNGAYDPVPTDDQATSWSDGTTQEVLATYVIPDLPAPGAAHDNAVWWDGLGHNSQDGLFRVPFGAINPGDELLLRFRAYHDDLTQVRVRFWDAAASSEFYRDMSIVASDVSCYDPSLELTCDYWQVAYTPSALTTLYYRFIAIDGTAKAYYADDSYKDGGWGETTSEMVDNSYVVTVFDPDFEPVSWMKDAVIYQIFPDRFRNGDAFNDPDVTEPRYGYPSGSTAANDQIMLKDWNDLPEGYCQKFVNAADPCDEAPRGRDYYGGDLKGLIEKLDYLDALGVKVIYLNPVFEAGSNHLYDTQDYSLIDHFFGDNEDFVTLAEGAHSRGMKILLDGVFNHVSSDSPYMDRYGHYTEVGACESLTSPYRDWFTFHDVAAGSGVCVGTAGPNSATYDGWWSYDSLPVLNKYNEEVKDLIYDTNAAIARYWLDLGADGWRLDVMPDASFPVGFWQAFRDVVLEAKPDAVIIGELWKKGDVLPLIHGDQADSTMNYRFRNAILGFFGKNDDKGFLDDNQSDQPPSLFARKLLSVREDYPDATYYMLMNLLGTHDTMRVLWAMTPGDRNREEKEFDAANLALGKELLELAVVVQMTTPGAPTIYYGDEVGVTGDDDPDDRRTFPWDERYPVYMPMMFAPGTLRQVSQPAVLSPQASNYYGAGGDHELLDWYRRLTSVRNDNEVFRDGELTFLLTDDTNRTLAYLMRSADQAAVVAINRDPDNTRTLEVDISGYMPRDVEMYDLLANVGNVYAVNGLLTFDLEPLSAVIFFPTPGQDLYFPTPPTDLQVTAGNGEVDLTWLGNAYKFNVYRSPVAGGGYVLVGSTYGHSFNDDSVVNGKYYYYVVRGEDAAGNLGPISNEAEALPYYPIGSAELISPATITHTLGITPTEDILGQVYVSGFTDVSGSNPGDILAELGYGADGSDPTTWTMWKPMDYDTKVGDNFQYKANLRPEAAGEYDYEVRFSTNLGIDWTYGLLSGLPGALTVNPNTDTDPPVAPANLRVTDWSSGFITVVWDSVADAAEYWLYRSTISNTYGAPLVQVTAPITTYTDLSVDPGFTYYYVVKAVDNAMNLSPASNEVSQRAEPKMVNVTFRVGVPAETPPGDTIYIVGGTLPLEWDPDKTPMTYNSGFWEVTLQFLDGLPLEYKYTRGNTSWNNVEWWGIITSVANRSVSISYGTDGNQLVDNTATDWGTGPDSEKAVQYWRDPLVGATVPADGYSGTAPMTVTVGFVREIQPPSGGDFDDSVVVTLGSTPISGTVALAADGRTLVWTPAAALAVGTYTVTVFNVRSNIGDAVPMLVAYVFEFTVV